MLSFQTHCRETVVLSETVSRSQGVSRTWGLGEQVKPACAGGRQAAGDWRQWPSRGARRRPSVHRS